MATIRRAPTIMTTTTVANGGNHDHDHDQNGNHDHDTICHITITITTEEAPTVTRYGAEEPQRAVLIAVCVFGWGRLEASVVPLAIGGLVMP
jgi:hypothetical protein